MYHGPKMCRTCLQMSRGDFKFVSLDSVDPLWESNSPNLKAQLMSLVPEMKIEDYNAYICTSCFIALRTAYEFKRMCQATEKRFQTHNYKYRRPFGVGPGSPQFHVTLNENRGIPQATPANNIYRSQKLNYLQADTSIDITEHHLYDASRNIPRRLHYINNVTQKLPEIDLVVLKSQNSVVRRPLNSQELKEKFNLGSQISIVQPKNVVRNSDANLIKLACEEIPYLKENNLGPDALRCRVRIQVLTPEIIQINTVGKYSLDEIKGISHSYYFDRLEEAITCQFCPKTFMTRFLFQMHQFEEHADKLVKAEEVKEEVKPIEQLKQVLPRKLFKVMTRKFKLRKYKRCFICRKVCVSRVHLLQHCKYMHVPRYARKKKVSKKVSEAETQYLPKLRVRTRHQFVSTLRCTICDKGFLEQSELDVHMYVHTPVVLSSEANDDAKDDDAECLFTCYLCGKSFLKERFLKLHNIQMHLRNKPTTCKNCGRVFKSEFWYERHRCALPPEEVQPDEIPDETNMFSCSFCERKFNQLRFMKIHRRRAHKYLMASRGPKDRSEAEPPILESTKDADPMELYSIAGTSSFGDEAVEGDGDTGSESTDEAEEHTDSIMEEDEEENNVKPAKPTQVDAVEDKPIKVEPLPPPPPQIEAPLEPSGRRGRSLPLKDIKPLIEEPEISFGRGRNRGLPKIQCDFCGELIEENRYDKHIAEHNKSRLQRRTSTTTTHIEEYDSDDLPLKCPVCYKGFKRKYYYNIHINKHIEEGVDVQEAPPSPVADNPTTPTSTTPIPQSESQAESDEDDGDESYVSEAETSKLEEDDIQGEEIILEDNSKIYTCCGRSFKLKAHFFRHYKIKHPNNVNKRHPIKYAEPVSAPSPAIQPPLQIEIIPSLEVKKIEPKLEKTTEPVSVIKSEPQLPNDLEIGLKEEMELKPKRKFNEAENDVSKKIKTENAEAVKLRNTVAAHLDDIEIVPVSPTPSLKYECNQCDRKFRQKCQLRDHLNVHTGEKPYKCEFCQPTHGFTQSSSLYFHIRKVHTAVMKNVSWAIQSKSGLCLVCLEVFERHMAMYSHLRENYVESGFDCEMCSKNVTMTCHYKVHNIDPNDMDSFMLPQQNLEVVLTEDAEEDKTAADESCDSSLASTVDEPPDNLNEADVIMSKARRCEPCGKMFKSVQYYNLHIRSLIHKQRADAFANQSDVVEKDDTSEPVDELNQTSVDENEVNMPKEDESANIDTIKEIEDNCKAITKKIQRIGTFKCPVCSLLFITRTHLRKHRRTQHHIVYAMHEKRRKKPLVANDEDMETDFNTTTEDTNEDSNKTEGDTESNEHTGNEIENTTPIQNEDDLPFSEEPEADTPAVDSDQIQNTTLPDTQDEPVLSSIETKPLEETQEVNPVKPIITENEDMPLLQLDEDVNPRLLPEISSDVRETTNSSESKNENEEMPLLQLDEDISSQLLADVSSDLGETTVNSFSEPKQNSENVLDDHNITLPELPEETLIPDKTEDVTKDVPEQKYSPAVNEEPVKDSATASIYSPENVTNQNSENLQHTAKLSVKDPIKLNQEVLENKDLHLHPKYYRSEQIIPQSLEPPPLHYNPIMQRRLSYTYSGYTPMNEPIHTNYFSPLQPQLHSTFIPSHRESHLNSNNYTPLYEQGFVMQEDDMLDKGLSQAEPDLNPEQDLLDLLHTSNNSLYDMKKCDGSGFDSEQEFIDLESAGPKILKQSLEGLQKAEEGGNALTADSSKPELLYGKNPTSNDNVNLLLHPNPNESIDYQGRLPISHVLNEVTRNFS